MAWTLNLLAVLMLTASCHIQKGLDVPEEKFIFVDKQFKIEVCNVLFMNCTRGTVKGYGSGVLVGHNDDKSYILTVAHVCKEFDPILPPFYTIEINERKMRLRDSMGGSHKGEVVAKDIYNDMCLIETERIDAEPMKLARRGPEKYHTYHNLAAPYGIWERDNILLLEGKYNGHRHYDTKVKDLPPGFPKTECNDEDDLDTCLDDRLTLAMYTIPAAGGSSGSPVFNERGELVGILSRVVTPGYYISYGPTYEKLKSFLNKNLP